MKLFRALLLLAVGLLFTLPAPAMSSPAVPPVAAAASPDTGHANGTQVHHRHRRHRKHRH
jgi:hypothetical protein